MAAMGRATLLFPLFLLAAFACSSTEASKSSDAPEEEPSKEDDDDSSKPDDAAVSQDDDDDEQEPSGAKQTETEPNNGASKTDLGKMTLPGEMKGAIDPESDVDAFSVALKPGELWEWTLTPDKDLAPHLVVFDTAADTLNPVRLTQSSSGTKATLSHFVLRPGTFAAVVRDARNVAKPPAGVGGAAFGYTLSAKKKTVAGTAVTFPSKKAGTLASLSALDFYTFDGTEGTGFDIVLKAERKDAPSSLDSRISLFNLTSKTAVITNDDAANTTDSEIGGSLPATASYLLVVESEGTDDSDLSYELSFSLR